MVDETVEARSFIIDLSIEEIGVVSLGSKQQDFSKQ